MSQVQKTEPAPLTSEQTRQKYGYLCGIAGIFFNLLLFAGKLMIGTVSGSIAITADAFNNLSDATSSCVTLLGFRLSSKRADSAHPFGHGRIEYLAGILISVLILYVGVELFRSSFDKILHPEEFVFGPAVALVLILSISVKLFMAFYNRHFGKKINSPTLLAAATDSISDSVSTAAVLLCAVFSYLTKLQIDGYVGAAVSLLIIYSGIRAIIDTASPLLGQPPAPEFVRQIETIVRENPETRGIHDLVVHDYGPSKVFVSLHMEVDGTRNLFELHDAVDLTEHRIASELHCEAVIHMDPIDVNNPVLTDLHTEIFHFLGQRCPGSNIHDLRMVPGPTHTNLIFDLVLPPEAYPKRDEIVSDLKEFIKTIDSNYFAVIEAELSYCTGN